MVVLPRRERHTWLIPGMIGGPSWSPGFVRSRRGWRHKELSLEQVVAVNFVQRVNVNGDEQEVKKREDTDDAVLK